MGEPRFRAILLLTLSILALVLAAVGVYSVTNYSVMQQAREFAIYQALGATSVNVRRRVVRHAAIVIGFGLAGGLAASLALVRLIEGLLFRIEPLDPLTFLVVPAFLFLIACVASTIPAWRATRVEPIVALRLD